MKNIHLTYISLITSITALCIAYFRCKPLIILDWMNFTLAVLAVLVTALIGWNIFQLCDFREKEKRLMKMNEKIGKELNYIHNKASYNQAVVYTMMSQSASAFLCQRGKDFVKFQMLLKGISALKILSNFPDCENEIKALSDSLLEGLECSSKIKLSDNERTEFLIMCGEIQNKENIPKYDEIVALIK